MSEKNEHFENFILVLLVGGVVIGFTIYVIVLFWPYVVFYVLPLLASTFIVGWVLRISIAHMEGGGEIEGSYYEDRQYHPLFHYRNLLIVYPVMIFATLLIFDMNSVQMVQVDKKGKEVGLHLDWPSIHHRFNEFRSSAYASSPFDSLKQAAKEEVLYDRRQIGWIVWFALFLGGPAYCYWLSRRDFDDEGKWIYKKIEERVKTEKDILHSRIKDQEKIVADKVAKYQEALDKIKSENQAIRTENQKLRATVEFSNEVPKPLADPTKKGVLDSDLL